MSNPTANWISPSRYVLLKYLKHCGKIIDVKVSVSVARGFPMIFIRDMAFIDYDRALQYLRHIAESELISYAVNKDTKGNDNEKT